MGHFVRIIHPHADLCQQPQLGGTQIPPRVLTPPSVEPWGLCVPTSCVLTQTPPLLVSRVGPLYKVR